MSFSINQDRRFLKIPKTGVPAGRLQVGDGHMKAHLEARAHQSGPSPAVECWGFAGGSKTRSVFRQIDTPTSYRILQIQIYVLCIYIYDYVYIFICIHIYIYVCMYVCMYVYIYIYINMQNSYRSISALKAPPHSAVLFIYPLIISWAGIENDHRNSEFSHEKWFPQLCGCLPEGMIV